MGLHDLSQFVRQVPEFFCTLPHTLTYVYDADNQLTSEKFSGSGATLSYYNYNYSYDNDGRVSTQPHWSQVGTTVYSGTNTYSYDTEGNTISKTTGSGMSQITWSYRYDNANEMTGVVETQGGTTLTLATYVYDAEGDRVRSQVWTAGSGTTTTRYAFDPVRGQRCRATELSGA